MSQLTPYQEQKRRWEPLLSQALPKISEVFDDGRLARRFQRIALSQFTQESGLYNCTPSSVLGCLLECAELNLEPGVAGQCWIVRYKDKATLIVGYMGFAQLAWRSGHIASMNAEAVYEMDPFEFFRGYGAGREPFIEHGSARLDGVEDPGPLVAAYAAIETVHGKTILKVLSRPEVEKRRKSSRGATAPNSPWVTHEEAMWRKSAIRAAFPLLPWTPESRRAFQADTTQEMGKQELEVNPMDFADLREIENAEVAAVAGAAAESASLCMKDFGSDGDLCQKPEGHAEACS